jgi:hypothetical protein
MKKRSLFTLFIALTTLVISACGATFHGRIIDADTREPIEGAAVVASWSEERATIAGPTGRLKDVKETLTDKNGEWVIKGPKGRIGGDTLAMFTFFTGMYYTEPPLFIVFKPGYCSHPNGFSIESCKGKIKPENRDKLANGETVELPRLENREDRRRNSSISLPDTMKMKKKLINLIRLLDEEEAYLYPGFQGKSLYKELLREFNYEK